MTDFSTGDPKVRFQCLCKRGDQVFLQTGYFSEGRNMVTVIDCVVQEVSCPKICTSYQPLVSLFRDKQLRPFLSIKKGLWELYISNSLIFWGIGERQKVSFTGYSFCFLKDSAGRSFLDDFDIACWSIHH